MRGRERVRVRELRARLSRRFTVNSNYEHILDSFDSACEATFGAVGAYQRVERGRSPYVGAARPHHDQLA